jgi:hypothetical protein
MFIHPPSTTYVATVEGSVDKDVTCERCGHTYSYRMVRIVSAFEKVLFFSSRGDEKALKKARASLARALEAEHDDVPCPACQWHQSSHVAFVCSRSYPQLRSLAGAFFIFAALVLGIIIFVFALGVLLIPGRGLPQVRSILQCAILVLAVASPGLLLRGLRSLLLLNYRPNG